LVTKRVVFHPPHCLFSKGSLTLTVHLSFSSLIFPTPPKRFCGFPHLFFFFHWISLLQCFGVGLPFLSFMFPATSYSGPICSNAARLLFPFYSPGKRFTTFNFPPHLGGVESSLFTVAVSSPGRRSPLFRFPLPFAPFLPVLVMEFSFACANPYLLII